MINLIKKNPATFTVLIRVLLVLMGRYHLINNLKRVMANFLIIYQISKVYQLESPNRLYFQNKSDTYDKGDS